jgi:hypothetical protein
MKMLLTAVVVTASVTMAAAQSNQLGQPSNPSPYNPADAGAAPSRAAPQSYDATRRSAPGPSPTFPNQTPHEGSGARGQGNPGAGAFGTRNPGD